MKWLITSECRQNCLQFQGIIVINTSFMKHMLQIVFTEMIAQHMEPFMRINCHILKFKFSNKKEKLDKTFENILQRIVGIVLKDI